jgi:LmbE family N-acetylglucosaminyl deacetylase
MTTLAENPAWQPPDKEMLVIAPHPDDETLAVGGFIVSQVAKGIQVRVVAVTDGENAYADVADLAAIRSAEQKRALAKLGVGSSGIIRLGLPDSSLIPNENRLIDLLYPLVSKETHLLAPWPGDFHPDHEVCGRAAQEVARSTGATLTFYFFWAWHRGIPALLHNLPLRSFALTADQQCAKVEALSEHRSQLEHPSGEPILPEDLLWPARRSCEIFLPA